MEKEKTLVRIVTTGSVDDGKSTLIGRLLFETNSIFEDQFTAIQRTSARKGYDYIDLSLILDGLSAEREQGITIDVAHIYFSTPNRKYIIADSPGHVQYTRNMVTGASNSELAIILIDARSGVLTQSKRHGFLVSLLQIPHMIVAINKMDLVDYSEDVYWKIVKEYEEFSAKLNIHDITFIPVSALRGDNVVHKSDQMPWYDGPSLLHYIENVHVAADRNLVDFRFPVQFVIRSHLDFRGYTGRISSGTITPGEEIVVLPSGKSSKVKSIITYDGELQEAYAGQSVVLTLEDEIDISRGDMIVRKNNLPQIGNRFEAMMCWMDEKPMVKDSYYILKHSTKAVKAYITQILYKIDMNTLHRERTDSFELNDIGRVEINTSLPIFFDSYASNLKTGCFVLIDPLTNNTVAAGMIRGPVKKIEGILESVGISEIAEKKSLHTVWTGWNIPREVREERNRHCAVVLWFTGLSGSGKSTITRVLENRLFQMGCHTMLLDGDNLRHGLCSNLGFSQKDRSENIRRAGESAALFFEHGNIVTCSFISPYRADRAFVRALFPQDRFFEIYVKCDLEECIRRDPNGLYKKAIRGEIEKFTGISDPYEEPQNPDLILETENSSIDNCLELIIKLLQERNIIKTV
jgi:bifunctional enzyme CysN/CysC